MAIKKFINSGLFYQGNIIDRFRRDAGFYETPDAIQNQKSADWKDKKINFAVYSGFQNNALELGSGEGCFDINDISKTIPIAIYSNFLSLADWAHDEAGRTLDQFTEVLYGLPPDGSSSPLIEEAEKGFLPFGDAGIFNKTFFNTMFYDHNFEFDMPEKNNNINDEIIAKEGTTTYGIKAEYNYYVKEYEDTIANNTTFESITPYLYSYADVIYSADIDILKVGAIPKDQEEHFKYKNLANANRLYLNDPKRQIFLGGSSTAYAGAMLGDNLHLSFDIKGALGFYWPEQNNVDAKYIIDFWPDNDALQWIAICENSMKNKAYKGLGNYGPDLVEYDFKGKQISFASYFKSWSHRYNNPAGKDLVGNAEGTADGLTNFMRNWIQYKYKNILFSDMDLMKYNFGLNP